MSLLRTLRKQINLTTYQVAEAVGCNQSQYSRIESGQRRPSPDLANRIAQYFENKITRDQILFPEDYVSTGKKPSRSVPAHAVVQEAQ